jgi:hypothetical protein
MLFICAFCVLILRLVSTDSPSSLAQPCSLVDVANDGVCCQIVAYGAFFASLFRRSFDFVHFQKSIRAADIQKLNLC